MVDSVYKKLKKQNGEKFAQTIRDYHNGILEIPNVDVILQHAGRDAKPLQPYLMKLLSSNANKAESVIPEDPFELLDQAGYKAFHADTLEKQNSIKHYFKQGELLCTFNDNARYKRYHIVHAIKKDVDNIKREDFKGKERRQDAYGTSVISIQMLKEGGFISIKNRYNHSVSNCDNTFNSNPDNIIQNLSLALKDRFNVEFSAAKSPLPKGFVLIGEQVLKYYQEINNIYYGDQRWAKDGEIHTVDKSVGDALFDRFLFDNKSKTLKNIDPSYGDSFVDDFNRCYGGSRGLSVQNGNLTLNGDVLIGAEKSKIKTLYLPELITMSDYCLYDISALTHFEAPALTTMGYSCLHYVDALTKFEAPALTVMGNECLYRGFTLTQFESPALTTMGCHCLSYIPSLTQFKAPALVSMDHRCLHHVPSLIEFNAPSLEEVGYCCFNNTPSLTEFNAPSLTKMGNYCLRNVSSLTKINVASLTKMGENCVSNASSLKEINAPILTIIGNYCFEGSENIKSNIPSPLSRALKRFSFW